MKRKIVVYIEPYQRAQPRHPVVILLIDGTGSMKMAANPTRRIFTGISSPNPRFVCNNGLDSSISINSALLDFIKLYTLYDLANFILIFNYFVIYFDFQ